MKLMSGSLVLRSGVGTQMLMVSSSSTAEKSVVARSLPDFTSGPRVDAGNVADVRIARVDAAGLLFAEIDAGDRESGFGEFHRQRQADIAQSDDADAGGAGADLFLRARRRRLLVIADACRHEALFSHQRIRPPQSFRPVQSDKCLLPPANREARPASAPAPGCCTMPRAIAAATAPVEPVPELMVSPAPRS